jgi:MOSC domain-containing protein YiiM
MQSEMVIDSHSVGDPERFRALSELERELAALPSAAQNAGRVALLVKRGPGGRRETPERVRVGSDVGIPGDAWGRPGRDGEKQIAVMQRDIAELIANGQPLTLFGDNLFLDLDLASTNLPIGSRVQAGGAIFEVTPMPHNGCHKFRARFGDAALRFVNRPDLRHRNLRGIYLRVVEGGELAVGDPVEIIGRGPAASTGG